MNLRLFPILVLLAAVGCDNPAPQPATPTQPQPPPAETADVTPAAPVTPKVATADVEARIADWVASQNEGDFARYSGHYAERLTGVKRVGARTYRYDRAGWLSDRERMFKKKMTVKAQGVQVTPSARSAVARFTQHWSSGTYSDVGPKQLVFMLRDDGSLAISREEMLSSKIVDAAAEAGPPDPTRLAIVVGSEQGKRGWLALEPASPDLELSAAELVEIGDVATAIAKVQSAPPKFKTLLGSTFEMEGECKAEVTGFAVVARAVPHFAQVDEWTGRWQDDAKEVPPQRIAADVFDLGSPGTLVAELDEGCDGRWGYLTGSPAPVDLGDREDVGKHGSAVVKRFRALPAYREMQKYFTQDGGSGNWDAAEGGRLELIGFGVDRVEYVAVAAELIQECQKLNGSLWAIFQVAPDGQLALMTDGKAPGELFEPHSAIRTPDGSVKFLSHDQIVEKVGSVWKSTVRLDVPYYDCPC